MVVVWYKLMRALNSSVFAQILAVFKCLCVSDRMIDLCLPAQLLSHCFMLTGTI